MAIDAQQIPLKDVAAVAAGYPLRTAVEVLGEGDVHFVQLKNVDVASGSVDWAQVPTVALPSARQPAWLTDSDVIFSARGTRTYAYALANTPAKAVCAPQFFVLTVREPGHISPDFLAWQINQRPAQDYFERTATGSYIQNIRRQVLEELPISVPPMQTQKLAVEFWRSAQRERAILNQLIENRNTQLEAFAMGLLQPYSGAAA